MLLDQFKKVDVGIHVVKFEYIDWVSG